MPLHSTPTLFFFFIFIMEFEGCFDSYIMDGPFPLESVVHPDGSHNLTMYDSYNHNVLGNNPSNYTLAFDQSNNTSLNSLNDVNNARSNLGTPIACFDNNVNMSCYNVNQQSMEGVDQFMLGQTDNDNIVYPQSHPYSDHMEFCGPFFPSNNFSNLVEEHDNFLFDHSVIGDGSSPNQANQKDVLKRPWTAEEDQKLVHLVNLHGVKDWSRIAQTFSFRIGKQCRERWYSHLRPGIKKGPWSEEEDIILILAHSELGNKWSAIAKHIRGRTENSIKNRWNANKRKWSNSNNIRRRRCRNSGSSLLQNYMQSLAQFPPAGGSENMTEAVQQISNGDQGASSSSSNLSNSGIDMGIDWSGAMLSSLVMSENENWEMDLSDMTAFDNSFIF